MGVAGASPSGSYSPVASPNSSGSAVSRSVDAPSAPEEVAANHNESISVDEFSSGDGDLDLALGGSGTERSIAPHAPATAPPREAAGGALKPSQPPFASTTAASPCQDEEVDEEIDEEDASNNSHESYNSSEAALSTGALSRGDDAGF